MRKGRTSATPPGTVMYAVLFAFQAPAATAPCGWCCEEPPGVMGSSDALPSYGVRMRTSKWVTFDGPMVAGAWWPAGFWTGFEVGGV